jgi:hypothetical protein
MANLTAAEKIKVLRAVQAELEDRSHFDGTELTDVVTGSRVMERLGDIGFIPTEDRWDYEKRRALVKLINKLLKTLEVFYEKLGE